MAIQVEMLKSKPHQARFPRMWVRESRRAGIAPAGFGIDTELMEAVCDG